MRITFLLLLIIALSSCGLLKNQTEKPTTTNNTNKAPKTRTIGQATDDIRISAGIHIDLYCLELFKPIDVKVKNGIVYYTGSVPSLKDSFAASGVAWKQNGVKEVINNLKVEKKNVKNTK